MVDAVDSNIHDLILQLVKPDKAYQDSGISRLLPIETVYKGYGLHNGVLKIPFDPPEEYGKSYEIEVNLSDDNDRIIKFTKVNNDIQKYNEWATGECRKYDQEMEGSKWQKPMYEYQLWQFVVTPAKPINYRKVDMDDMMKSIDSEELYHLKESLPKNEFVPRFNKTIYDYVRMRVDEAKEMDVWDENNIWYIPNQEFGTSGFTGLPAGYRYSGNGLCGNMSLAGYFWSSSETSSTNAWYRLLGYSYSHVARSSYDKQGGFSIRCLGD